MTKGYALIGIKGSGKTTFSSLLAKSFNKKLIETDLLIEEKVNLSCKDYFLKYGENSFRKIEKEVLLSLCYENNNIVSTGGGFSYHKDIIDEFKKYYHLIFIKTDPLVSFNRLNVNNTYLESIKDKKDLFVSQSLDRNSFYSKICDYVVYSSAKEKQDVFLDLKEYIEKYECK